MSGENSLEEDILRVFWAHRKPMTILELLSILDKEQIEVPLLYLNKVVQNLQQAGLLKPIEENQSPIRYKATISAFLFNYSPNSFFFRFCIRPKTCLRFFPKIARFLPKWLLSGLFILCFQSPSAVQQTIFNVPSADITPKGKLFLQHESQFQGWHLERSLK